MIDKKIEIHGAGKIVEPRYRIIPARLIQLGRSLEELLFDCRCSACRVKLESSATRPKIEAQISEISKCCSKYEGFRSARMAILEIVFRTLLAGGNRSMGLNEIYEIVTNDWSSATHMKTITLSGLEGMISRDNYYGLQAIPR